MIAHIPIPHLHVVVVSTALEIFPDTQVLMRNGMAGIYEKKTRERIEVVSAIMTSTRRITQVYPI
jgi:uncharacterized protein YlzI (FlbEa/FlbD family)